MRVVNRDIIGMHGVGVNGLLARREGGMQPIRRLSVIRIAPKRGAPGGGSGLGLLA